MVINGKKETITESEFYKTTQRFKMDHPLTKFARNPQELHPTVSWVYSAFIAEKTLKVAEVYKDKTMNVFASYYRHKVPKNFDFHYFQEDNLWSL